MTGLPLAVLARLKEMGTMSELTRRVQFGWLLLRGVAAREIPPGAAWRVWRDGDYSGPQ